MKTIYLDHAATSPISEGALLAYIEASRKVFGNAGSPHFVGREAKRALEESREKVLSYFNLPSRDLLFTSGATEANNIAIKGVAFLYKNRGKRIVSSLAEHPSVISPLIQLRDEFGYDVVFLSPKANGAIDVEELKEAVDKNTILVSIMAVNNETGAISPIKEIGEYLKAFPKCYFHVDATQAIGKTRLDYGDVDLLSSSAHKFSGPKGAGFLLYRNSIRFLSLNSGGEQEKGFRAGTEDIPAILALSEALEESKDEKEGFCRDFNQRIRAYLLSRPDLFAINSPIDASPYILNFSLLEHKASVIIEALSRKGICLSSFSACSSKTEAASKVILAMGLGKKRAENAIRVSFGKTTTMEEVSSFLEALDTTMKEVRKR